MSEGEDEEEGGHGRAAGDKAESKVAKRRCGGSMDLLCRSLDVFGPKITLQLTDFKESKNLSLKI